MNLTFKMLLNVVKKRSLDSSVSIPTGYGLEGSGSIPERARFSIFHITQTDTGVHPVS
jgi:hypothetical protein